MKTGAFHLSIDHYAGSFPFLLYAPFRVLMFTLFSMTHANLVSLIQFALSAALGSFLCLHITFAGIFETYPWTPYLYFVTGHFLVMERKLFWNPTASHSLRRRRNSRVPVIVDGMAVAERTAFYPE